jgi:hypothetical protein
VSVTPEELEIRCSYLRSHGMTPGGEELGDTSSIKTSFGQTKGSSQTGATGTAVSANISSARNLCSLEHLHYDRIILVFNERIFA